jgi:hypothetical protein
MTFRHAAAAFALFSALTAPNLAMAQDVPPVVNAILQNWEKQFQVKPTYKSITGDAANTVVEGLEANASGDAGEQIKFSVGKIELKNIADQGNGIIEVGQAIYTDFKLDAGAEGQNFTISIPQSGADNWYVKILGENPSPADTFRASMSVAKKMYSGPITLSVAGQNVTADGVEFTWDGDPGTGAGKSSGTLKNVVVPESAVAMIDPTGTLKQLGYSSLAFDLSGGGILSNDGTAFGMDFDTSFVARDMGTLKIGGNFAGVPIAALAEFQKTEPGKEPDMNALMPQFMNTQVSRLEFRFEDASISKKILPMIAQMQGMDEATFIANAGAMAQIGLAELKSPEFTQKAVAAINAFLNDPKSLTIAAKPAAPVTVMQMMSLDPANPGAAIQQLGIMVEANN